MFNLEEMKNYGKDYAEKAKELFDYYSQAFATITIEQKNKVKRIMGIDTVQEKIDDLMDLIEDFGRAIYMDGWEDGFRVALKERNREIEYVRTALSKEKVQMAITRIAKENEQLKAEISLLKDERNK